MLHVGLDLHKRFSTIATMDDAGNVQLEDKLYHDDRARLTEFFGDLAGKAVVTVEATRNWYWLYELLEDQGVTVKLADARKVRLIAEAQLKNDKVDPKSLAQLERTGFLPEAYIPPREIRDNREYLRYRLTLVRLRTGLKNKVHALVDKLGISHQFADLFGPAGRRFLSQLQLRPVYQEEMNNYLALVDDIERRIVVATKEIKRQLKPDPRAKLLMTLPAVGHLTSYLLLNEIGDIKRFPTPGKLCAYGGIVPIVRQSADHRWQGHITRAGNRYIRWALTEVACLAPSKDYALGSFYRRVAYRRGPLKARVAVARKLLVAVWYVLTYEEPYKPTPFPTV
jgi:transposase